MTILLNNRYQVIQVIGAGGFGETFLAEDTYMPSRRRCVIKQLKPITNNDPQIYKVIQQRFEREAATLEYLGENSDQIPKLYAYFSENGQFYLVQEWIHGETLTKIVEAKGHESETIVRQILLNLLPVLDYVHSKGIIHRDIKPENIILRSLDAKPVLIDFGAVKETIRSVVSSPGHPTKSLIIGTPGYMPSEQAVGRPVYATDIYSLGLTAVYLLTGKHPQELQTHLQTGEILWQGNAPNVSPEFAMVINQAIKPHAGDRFSTASKMLYALESASYILPQPATTSYTVTQSSTTTRQTQAFSSSPNTPAINSSGNVGNNWQRPAVIIGTLVVGGLIGAIAISGINRQQQSETITTTNSSSSSESSPTAASSNPSVVSQPSLTPIVPTPPARRVKPGFLPFTNPKVESDTPVTSTPSSENQPITSDTLPPKIASTPQPETENPIATVPTPKKTVAPRNKTQSPNNQVVTTSRQSVPAFPTGTSRSSVEAVLGRPNQDLKGAWGRTRAITYKYVPNQIDLGYLFDRNSGTLRQTEATFAQSVDPQVMQGTLNGMLGGQATAEIQQGLQQIQQRQLDHFSFTQGSVKGQIVRQNCDLIYISIWDKNLHDFGDPSSDKQC